MDEVVWGWDSNFDPCIETPYGIKFLKNSIETLVDGEWVDDRIMDETTNILIKQANSDGKVQYIVLDSHFFNMMEKNDLNTAFQYYVTPELLKADVVIILQNKSRNHWAVLSVSMKEGIIKRRDSLGLVDKIIMQRSCELFQKIDEFYNLGKKWKLKDEDIMKSKHQKNGYDCGVFAIAYVAIETGYFKDEQLDQKIIPTLRKVIIRIIMTGSIDGLSTLNPRPDPQSK